MTSSSQVKSSSRLERERNVHFSEKVIFTNVLVFLKLGEYCVWLMVYARYSNSHQKATSVSEHRLNFVVVQFSQVVPFDERIATAIKMHLTVHLVQSNHN